MKKIVFGVVLSLLVVGFSLGGCKSDSDNMESGQTSQSVSSDASMTFEPGTYQGTGEGKGGPIVVDVTFSKNKIESINIVEQHETEGLSEKSLAEIPQSVVANQSLGIEVVSGASMTNEGILEAISDAVKQAGGDVDALKNVPVEKIVSDEVIELNTDLVIVGGGASGMAAALRAEELGIKTILFEKMSYLGGAISISGGNQVVMGSELQKQAGVTDDSVESMTADFMKNGDEKNVPELLNLYAENVGETTDWLHEYVGIEYDMDAGLHQLAEYSYNRELAYTGGGPGFAKTAREAIENSNVDVYLETRVNKLVADEAGKIAGVEATADDGTTYKVSADHILIASGGYGNNPELLSENLKDVLYYGPESSTGDGIILSQSEDIDAATRLMEYGKTYPNGVEVSEGKAKSTIGGNIVVFKQNAILINKNGERVVNEKSSNRQILEVELEQPDQMLYVLMDQNAFDQFVPAVAEAGISETDINDWLSNNGAQSPHFLHGDSIEELAEVAAINPDVLKETVERYNGFVKTGEDTDFGRAKEFMPTEIGDGPYYLVEQKPRFATTMGGLVVTKDLQVVNKNGDAIEGLYAAGEIVGGVMGDDSPSGANNGWALTSGKLAAEAIDRDHVE